MVWSSFMTHVLFYKNNEWLNLWSDLLNNDVIPVLLKKDINFLIRISLRLVSSGIDDDFGKSKACFSDVYQGILEGLVYLEKQKVRMNLIVDRISPTLQTLRIQFIKYEKHSLSTLNVTEIVAGKRP